MPQNVLDRRVQKTRKLLQEALIELVAEKGYESVTIREILDKANVGRSTFYAHFQDKDQLLHSILDRLDELFEQHKKQLLDATKNSGNPDNTELTHSLSPTLSLFQFVGQNHRFFKAMLGNRGYGIFAKPVYDYVFAHLHGIFTKPVLNDVFAHLHEPFKMLISREKYDSLEAEIAAHYFASALMGILVWWVEKDMPCTAEEVDGLFRQLAMPGFRHVLAVNHGTQ
ncbi:MAG: TetR/AcrR family transcriptional regulator [Chloroflexi bacterium]|nr:TetR/AcrR family transcriptional regulator [Chloroflexota bacterium]MCI0645279.1 TetR/AcrR family transcriptional regulator [Chloroflexota bacterium]